MNRHDEEFENLLRQFQPRRPRPLPEVISERRIRRRVLLASALLVLVCAGVLHFTSRGSYPKGEQAVIKSESASPAPTNIADVMTAGSLGNLGLTNPDDLDLKLTEASQHLLPHVERSDSMLHALAQE